MATNIVTNATVNVQVNGQNAEQTLDNLRAKTKAVKDQITDLLAKDGPLTAEERKKLKALRGDFKLLSQELNRCEREMSAVESVLHRLDTASPKELQKALSRLKRELNEMHRGSEAWNAHTEKIKKIQAALNQVNAELREQESRWERFNRKLNDYQTAMMGVIGVITGLIMAGRSAVNSYAEIEESLMNTQKYTGLTKDAVRELNEEFKRIDTRLYREDLNELAQEGGRLGKNTKETVKEYVEAAQIIKVALVDLGEGATQTIAKIANIFGEEERLGTKRSMLAIGSAVNELSQNCTASKPYLVDFAQRMAGIGAQAGLTVPQIIAFGAVLDSNGQKVEMSATAIQKVIMALAQKNREFSEVLGLDAEKLNAALKRSAKDGLLMYLEGIKKLSDKTSGNNATIALAPLFKDMGMDAARVATVLATLANHIDEIKWQLGEADKAYEEASSATREFAMFNETVQAQIEKAKGRMQELSFELGEKLYPILKHVYTSSSLLLRALNEIVTFVIANSGKIVTLVSAIAAYNVAVRLATIRTAGLTVAQKAHAVALGTWKAAMLLCNVLIYTYSKNQVRAEAATRLFFRTIKMNPFGFYMSLLAGVITLLAQKVMKTNELRKSLEEAMKASSGWADSLTKERKEIDGLVDTLRSAKKGTKEYDEARDRIMSKYGAYLQGLIDEKGEITNLTLAYDRLSWAAEKSAQARALFKAKENLESTYLENVNEKVTKLRESLKERGMDIDDISRIVKAINESVAKGEQIPRSIASEVALFESENGFWKQSKKKGFLTAMRNELSSLSPREILGEIMYGKTVYDDSKKQLSQMDNRYLREMPGYTINGLIDQLQHELSNTVQKEFHIEFDGWTELVHDELAEHLEGAIRDNDPDADKQLVIEIDGMTIETGMRADDLRTGIEDKSKEPSRIFTEERGYWLEGTITRTEAERLLRELLFEREQRGGVKPSKERAGKPGGGDDFSYVSAKDGDKEARKRAAEERAALLKARQEFRDGLNAIRAEREQEEAAVIAAYSRGEIKYLDYMERRKGIEERFYDRSRQFYEENFKGLRDYELSEDKDYQKLLSDKEAAMLRYGNKIVAIHEGILKRQSEAEIRELERMSGLKENRTLEDEEELSQRVLDIRVRTLQARMKLYQQGSEQWEKLSEELEDVQEKDRFEREKRYQERVREARKKYRLLSAAEQYEIEKKALEAIYNVRVRKLSALLSVRKLTLEQYQAEMRTAEEELKRLIDLLGKKSKESLPGSDYERKPSEVRQRKQERIDQANSEIDKGVASGMISEDEGKRRKGQVLKDELSDIREEMANTGSEWMTLVSELSWSFFDLWQSIDLGGDVFTNLGKTAEATFAVITAGMQVASQFAQANAKIETAAVEKRYDREMELAQGNTYLTKKLEEEKQRKVAEIKNRASQAEFRMSVIQATGTMIMGAMNAYTSTLKIPVVGPALAPAAAAVAMAAGAVNLALLTKQQEAAKATGYASGGYTRKGRRDEEAGVVHAGEWVAPQWMVDDPVAGDVIGRLESARVAGEMPAAVDVLMGDVARRNVIGSLTASDSERIVTGRNVVSSGGNVESSGGNVESSGRSVDRRAGDDVELAGVLVRLARRLDEPFVTVNTVTGPYGSKRAEDEYKRIMRNRRR